MTDQAHVPEAGSRPGRGTERVVADFSPAVHGFAFPNAFTNNHLTLPGGASIATAGRCGGMAWTALDYWVAKAPVPAWRPAHFAPSRVPPDGNWLADHLYSRLIDSFLSAGSTFLSWTMHADHATWVFKGVDRWTREDEVPKLVAQLRAGRPAVLGLIRARTLADVGQNHQVIGRASCRERVYGTV